MNIEKRLQSAANELNHASRRSAPPPFAASSDRSRPVLAFAAAFVVVLAVIGIPLVVSNLGTGEPANNAPLAGTDTSTTSQCIAETVTTVVTGQGEIHVIAFLFDEGSPGVPPGAHEELVEEVEGWPEVWSVTYVDKEHSWIEYQEIFEGEEELLNIDPSILPATIRIEVTEFESQSSIQELLEERASLVRSVATAPASEWAMGIWFGESAPGFEEGRADVADASVVDTDCVEDSITTVAPSDPEPGNECAAKDQYPPTTIAYSDDDSDPRDLTEPVRDKLTRIAEAASSCDADALAALAAEDITTTFGPGSGPEDIASWQSNDERFEIITALFNTSHGVTEMEDGSRIFVWPAAFAYDSWDEIPASLVEELLRIHTQEEIDAIAEFGAYAGWRIGITETGDWIFFVAGD